MESPFKRGGGFVKVLKTNSFYSRYQVKMRRRRSGQTVSGILPHAAGSSRGLGAD